jgi:hypothetical protein
MKKAMLVLASMLVALTGVAGPAAATITVRTYEGSGDDVIPVSWTENGLLQVSAGGNSNFAVWTLTRSGTKKELLVNTIGAYRGRVVFEAGPRSQKVAAVQIEAEGAWSATVRPLTAATNWRDSSISKSGDNVVQVFNRKLTLKSTYRGDENFAVWALDSDGDKIDLLVNTIGDYSGRTVLSADARYLSVSAGYGDPWTLTKR